MSIEEIEAAANAVAFERLGVSANVTHPGQAPLEGARVIIDRNATVTDDFGIVLESRCEIGLEVSQVGEGSRGTLVDILQPAESWRLLEPIGNDGLEDRWTAGRA